MAYCGGCRRAGVRLGMSVAQAVELARPDHVDLHDPGADSETIEKLAQQVAETISPMVAVEPLDDEPWAGHWRHQSESLWVDITGIDHLFEGAEKGILKAAYRMCREMNLRPRMAIADTPAAAWAITHYGDACDQIESVDDLPAKIALPGHGVTALLPLPVESLRISVSTVETLSRLGVTTLGELLRLPRSGVASRLGVGLIRRIDQITGQWVEPITIHDAPAEHVSRWDLEYPTTDVAILSDRLRRCTESIVEGLAVKGHGALCVTCRFDLAEHPPVLLDVGLFAPSRDVDHLHTLIAHHLESAALRSDANSITLSVVSSSPLQTKQKNLFPCDGGDIGSPVSPGAGRRLGVPSGAGARDRSFRHDPEIARLVDSIATRVGRTRVVQPQLTPDPLPESSFVSISLCGRVEPGGKKASASSQRRGSRKQASRSRSSRRRSETGGDDIRSSSVWNPSVTDALRRPLSLLPRPMPLLILGPSGRYVPRVSIPDASGDQGTHGQHDGLPPATFRTGGVVHRVTRWWGPERIETDWWKGSPVSRDYFRIETNQDAWWWVFRERASVHEVAWFLHGRFS